MVDEVTGNAVRQVEINNDKIGHGFLRNIPHHRVFADIFDAKKALCNQSRTKRPPMIVLRVTQNHRHIIKHFL